MVDSIEANYVRQFSDQVHLAAQQMQTRLKSHVILKAMKAEDFAYDGLESVEAHEVTGRNSKTVFSDITHNRRKILPQRFAVALPIDVLDAQRILIDPQSDYAGSVARALMRKIDKVIVDAMFADVSTGKSFGTTVTFANDGGTTVNATAGLTYEKLLEIHENFIDDEVGNDLPEDFVLGITGKEHTSLMKESELTSGDFSRDFVVEGGSIVRAAGFKLVRFGASATLPILAVSGTTRDCFAMTGRAICVGISKDITVRVDVRTDLNMTVQVYADMTYGAVRTEGKLIQKVQTSTT